MTIFIEEKQTFSNSALWAAQREYYDTEGIEAWTADVPFYVTSNPFIAQAYAKVAIRFIQDWIKQNPNASDEPFYFLELGTGPGQFSYYLLKALTTLSEKLGLENLKLRYIMSDFTFKNIEFWSQHEQLRPYIEAGILDFAQFDLENDTEIELTNSTETLKPGSLKNPLIVVANYIFDTLRTDIFTIEDGQLKESLVSLHTTDENIEEGKPKDWEKVEVTHEGRPIKEGYYQDPHYNSVLEIYRQALKQTHFLFPTATLNALKHLNEISNDKMLVLASDKAYSTLEEQDELEYPELAFHGSFSVMANLDAIARVAKASGGDALLQTPREGITTAVFAYGFQFGSMPETRLALDEYVEGFSPGDYFILHDQICNADKDLKAEVYSALLSMSQWDPYVYGLVCDRIIELLDDIDHDTLEYLKVKMELVADNFYFLPGSDDLIFNVALFYHEIEDYKTALKYYTESWRLFGEQHVTIYNIAICHYELGELEKALELFERSLELDPKQKDAKDWVSTVKEKLEEQA